MTSYDFFLLFAVNVYAESSYVTALSLAVITHTVARACEEHLLTDCSCTGPDGEEGCPSNVAYGLYIARKFLDYRFSASGGGIRHQLALHVFRATENVSGVFFSPRHSREAEEGGTDLSKLGYGMLLIGLASYRDNSSGLECGKKKQCFPDSFHLCMAFMGFCMRAE